MALYIFFLLFCDAEVHKGWNLPTYFWPDIYLVTKGVNEIPASFKSHLVRMKSLQAIVCFLDQNSCYKSIVT